MRRVKKNLMAVCVGMMLLAGVTGCTKTVESSQQTQEDSGNEASRQADLAPNEIASQDGTEFLSGKIQRVEEDSMIIAQTTILEDGMVTLVDEKDAKKISIKFIEDTKVEHWTIKGGGADIDRKDAALSDLTAGMGVEMEGYYEGEIFVAIRVLIEEYV